MVIITCTIPMCDSKTDDVSEALAIALLANHSLTHQCTLPDTTGPLLLPVPLGPKLEWTKVNISVSTGEWTMFIRHWEVLCTGSGIDDESAPSQLFQCAENELSDSLLKANPDATSNTLPDLLAAMCSLAVIPVYNWCPFHTFTARVCGWESRNLCLRYKV